MTALAAACPLCLDDGGLLIVRNKQFRIVRVQGAEAVDFPAFYRVIWNDHAAELTDLPPVDRQALLEAVTQVEAVLRQQLQPVKINLASLGNVVPHLHWHVVARFEWDSRFPAPIWAAPVRTVDAARSAQVVAQLPACDAAIAACCGVSTI